MHKWKKQCEAELNAPRRLNSPTQVQHSTGSSHSGFLPELQKACGVQFTGLNRFRVHNSQGRTSWKASFGLVAQSDCTVCDSLIRSRNRQPLLDFLRSSVNSYLCLARTWYERNLQDWTCSNEARGKHKLINSPYDFTTQLYQPHG